MGLQAQGTEALTSLPPKGLEQPKFPCLCAPVMGTPVMGTASAPFTLTSQGLTRSLTHSKLPVNEETDS